MSNPLDPISLTRVEGVKDYTPSVTQGTSMPPRVEAPITNGIPIAPIQVTNPGAALAQVRRDLEGHRTNSSMERSTRNMQAALNITPSINPHQE